MAALVTPVDVENRLMGKTFTADESAVVKFWIGDLEADIRARISNLTELAEDSGYLSTLKRVITAAIKRVLDNPKGLRQMSISIDDYNRSETIDSSASAGLLYIADDDWGLLVPLLEGDAFSIRSYGEPDRVRNWISSTAWEPR
ncbi:hypothetical protein ACHABQ_02940 [Nesterenkonia aurantiaca]|uniref:hypothetical protein n=1 Tax=Nesterenkonia aurantiaca TaxID=1436010 RepID=UPI003EE6BA70